MPDATTNLYLKRKKKKTTTTKDASAQSFYETMIMQSQRM